MRGLQKMLDTLSDWCNRWRMDINESKTKVIHFRKGSTRRANYNFMCGEKSLTMIENYKYLGIWFNEFLDYGYAVKEISKSATRALGLIIAKFKSLGGISYACFKKLYESSVESILRYASGIWGVKERQVLNTVQNKAARFILGVNKTAPNLATRGDLGWISWWCKQKIEVVRLWLRLKNMDPTRITAKIFKYCSNKAINCKIKNWESTVIALLRSHEMSFLVNITDCDFRSVLEQCKDILVSADKNEWLNALHDDKDLPNGNKLRCYRSFKTELKIESYVEFNLPWYKKKIFAMLRAGCLPLEVETGRHSKPDKVPLHERLCKLCNSGEIEDEFHFVMRCNVYDDLRDSLFEIFTTIGDGLHDLNMHTQFLFIMQHCDYKTLNCIFKMWTRRLILSF